VLYHAAPGTAHAHDGRHSSHSGTTLGHTTATCGPHLMPRAAWRLAVCVACDLCVGVERAVWPVWTTHSCHLPRVHAHACMGRQQPQAQAAGPS